MKRTSLVVMNRYALLSFMLLWSVFGDAQDTNVAGFNHAYAGFVRNQDGSPLPGAQVEVDVKVNGKPEVVSAVTDEFGHYFVAVEDKQSAASMTVSVSGFEKLNGDVLPSPSRVQVRDFTLSDRVVYRKGRRATIILPTEPDPQMGRFYRLDRVEDGTVYFERELQPQANVPYVLFPDKDFEIAYDQMDLTGKAGTAETGGVQLVGNYDNQFVSYYENEYPFLLDATSDCGYRYSSDDPYDFICSRCQLGAMRAMLLFDASRFPVWSLRPKTSEKYADDWFDRLLVFNGEVEAAGVEAESDGPRVAPSSEMVCLAGFVKDQDGGQVAQARVVLRNEHRSYSIETDSYGHFLLPVEDRSEPFTVMVSAEGYSEQLGSPEPLDFSSGSMSKTFTIVNKAVYKGIYRATIMMPVAPNPDWGKYYRLARVEDGKLVFVREYQPKADVPYLLLPTKAFSFDFGDMEQPAAEPIEVSVPGARFVGYYHQQLVEETPKQYAMLLDMTPDCPRTLFRDHYPYFRGGLVGAFHAALLLDTTQYPWGELCTPDDDLLHDYYRWIGIMKLLEDDTSGVSSVGSDAAEAQEPVFDLQGRRVGVPLHPGLYIRNGQKLIYNK